MNWIISRQKILIYYSPKLFKVWKSWSSHPYNKMLILRIDPLSCFAVRSSFVFLAFITGPRNSCRINWNWDSIFGKWKSIIKISVSWDKLNKYQCNHKDWQQRWDQVEFHSNLHFCSCLDWWLLVNKLLPV